MGNFDDSGSGPLARVSVKGTVKWFNAAKGYGFVTLEDGVDAFCHASALSTVGMPSLPQGSTIVCDLQDSQRGLQVVAVHNVDTSTAEQAPPRRPRRDFGDSGDRFGARSGPPGGDHYGGGDRFATAIPARPKPAAVRWSRER